MIRNAQLFIENCQARGQKTVRHVTGERPAAGLVNQATQTHGLAES